MSLFYFFFHSSKQKHEEKDWYVECERQGADELLSKRSDGTFLIRPQKNDSDKFVLSIV